MALIILIAAIGFAMVFPIAIYNSLVSKRNQIDNAFAGIDVMLKKRYDLIPNLVSSVKGYAKHEAELLEKVTKLRSRAMAAQNENETVDLNNQITQTLQGILVTVEKYPDLKANENFLHLQRSLNEIEEQISASRRAFNAAVTTYNDSVLMFPSSIIASLFQFKKREVFQAPPDERKNINVGALL